MKWLKKNLSSLMLAVVISALSIPFATKIQEVVEEERTCVCSFDGYGYYAYLPQLVTQGHLNFNPKEISKVRAKYCGEESLYQFSEVSTSNHINIYHMGLSAVQAPGFLMAHILARIFDYPTDGFSKPYQLLFLLQAFFWMCLGLLGFYKLLRLWLNKTYSSAALLLVVFGTNVYVTFTSQYDLTHMYLFGLNAWWLYFLFSSKEFSIQSWKFILVFLIFGLTCFIRPTQVILGLVPAIYIWSHHGFSKKTFVALLWFPLIALLWNLPQFFYWLAMADTWLLPNLHVERILLNQPNTFDFLFSFRKGWLLYSPVFLLLIPAFFKLYKQRRELFWSILICGLTYIYIMSCWENWWYAASFGSRVMVDIYPLLFIPIALLLSDRQAKSFWIYSPIAILTLGLSLLQSYQFFTYYLPDDRMTKEHYFYIFGKTNIDDFNHDRLLIKTHPKELHQKAAALNVPIKETEILLLKDTLIHLEDTYHLLRKVPMNEWMNKDVVVNYSVLLKDSISNDLDLRLNLVRKHESYSWHNSSTINSKNEYKLDSSFVLPDRFHSSDELYIVLYSSKKQSLPIDLLSISFKHL